MPAAADKPAAGRSRRKPDAARADSRRQVAGMTPATGIVADIWRR